jgi:hypothetical protein
MPVEEESMSHLNASSDKHKTLQPDRFRFLRMMVAGMVILAVVLFMVAQVVNADAPAQPISALRSIVPSEEPPTAVPPTDVPPTVVPPTSVPPTGVPPTARPRPIVTPKPVLPKTGGEVETPAQNDNGLATMGIVVMGLLLVVGGVALSRVNSARNSSKS